MMSAGGVHADKEGRIVLVVGEHLFQTLESEFIAPRGFSRLAQVISAVHTGEGESF